MLVPLIPSLRSDSLNSSFPRRSTLQLVMKLSEKRWARQDGWTVILLRIDPQNWGSKVHRL